MINLNKMPIDFDLKKIKEDYQCNNYLETGMWDPRSDSISLRKALNCNFEKIFCIEIRRDFVKKSKQIFREHIKSKKLKIILDDSVNLDKHLQEDFFKNRTIFFLDAHVDNHNIINFKKLCPCLEELEAIKNLERKDNIILIDDLRIFKDRYPWGEKSYGTINFIEELKRRILEINKEYKFKTLNGHIEDDVLMAYI